MALQHLLLLLGDLADPLHRWIQVLEELLPIVFFRIGFPSGVLVEILEERAEQVLGVLGIARTALDIVKLVQDCLLDRLVLGLVLLLQLDVDVFLVLVMRQIDF